MIYQYFKRIFDILSASALLLVLSPLFFIVILLVRINLGTPVFFIQERSGLNRKPFKLIKFRSMTNACDKDGVLLSDEERQTKLGRLLRSTSLDELPELICIIKGDMSVIGPRPLPVIYDDYYKENELKRFNVRGGLIPPDSVDTSAIISWDKQFEYEIDYVDRLSLLLDLKIFFNVFRIIFQRKKTNYGSFIRQPLNEEREKRSSL